MKCVDDNPFRVLALPITASEREIAKQIESLESYAAMGKAKSFPSDLPFLPLPDRSVESIADAHRRIQLDEQRFLHSLFWYWNNSSVDELALDLLADGRVEKAIQLWENAAFKNRETVYSAKIIHENLFHSHDWSEDESENHRLSISGAKYTIERLTESSSSIPVVRVPEIGECDNWSIECEAEWMADDDNFGFGLVVGRNNSDFFSFEIAATGHYRFVRLIDWNTEALIEWTESDLIDGYGSNNLEIRKINDVFVMSINGQFAASITAEPLFGLNFGVRVAGEQTVEFRNLKVSELYEDKSYGKGLKVTSRNYSCIKNLSVLFLSLTDSDGKFDNTRLQMALELGSYLFLEKEFCIYKDAFVGERSEISLNRIIEFYTGAIVQDVLDDLKNQHGECWLSNLLSGFEMFPPSFCAEIRKQHVDPLIRKIEGGIVKLDSIKENDPAGLLEPVKRLISEIRDDLDVLEASLPSEDFQLHSISDKLSGAVVAAGIAYFNATKNDEDGLPLYEFGLAVARSQKAIEFAEENLQSCRQWIVLNGPAKKIIDEIDKVLNVSRNRPVDSIMAANSLMKLAKNQLEAIKGLIGKDSKEFELIADRVSQAVVNCGIAYFNATKNDEPCLPLYEYGLAVGKSANALKFARENVASCKDWIKNKSLYLCHYCQKNVPDDELRVTKTMYLETSRNYFPRRVEFSYGDVIIPRCVECAQKHNSYDSFQIKRGLLYMCCVIILPILAGGTANDQVPKSSPNHDSTVLVIVIVSALVGIALGWFLSKKMLNPVDLEGIRRQDDLSTFPIVSERLRMGWSFNKPSA